MLKIEIPYCSAVSETGSFVFCVYDVSQNLKRASQYRRYIFSVMFE